MAVRSNARQSVEDAAACGSASAFASFLLSHTPAVGVLAVAGDHAVDDIHGSSVASVLQNARAREPRSRHPRAVRSLAFLARAAARQSISEGRRSPGLRALRETTCIPYIGPRRLVRGRCWRTLVAHAIQCTNPSRAAARLLSASCPHSASHSRPTSDADRSTIPTPSPTLAAPTSLARPP